MKFHGQSKTALGAALFTALFSATAAAEVQFSADIELDTTIVDSAESDASFTQGGRVAINAYGRKDVGENFVESKGTAIVSKAGNTVVDDAWVKFGSSSWALQAGRFEAINLFPMGKDTLVLFAGDGSAQTYFSNMGRGRIGDDAGQLALTVAASDSVGLELDTVWGSTDGDDTDAVSVIRPSITFRKDAFSVTAGMEQASYDMTDGSSVDKTGLALTTSFNVGAAALNLNFSNLDDNEADTSVQTLGANVIVGGFGAGVVHAVTDNGSADDPTVSSLYLAYSMPLLDIEGATVTWAGSASSADNAGDNDSVNGVRARINYAF